MPTQCKKCREQNAVIKLKDPLCRDCFIGHVEHTFKMTLRMKCGITQKNERLLICASEGQNSAALLQLASDVVHNRCAYNKSKMFIDVHVLHIKETILWRHYLGLEYEDQVGQFVNSLQLPYTEIRLEQFMKYIEILSQLPEFGSAREDFVKYMKHHIIYKFAAEQQFTKILFAQNGQRLTSDLFSQLSKGKGYSLTSATKYVYEQEFPSQFFLEQAEQPSIKIQTLRPLKDLINKDVLFYLKNKNIERFRLGLTLSQPQKNKASNGNIDHLLEDFIDKLQVGFQSTVFTVLNTADKVALKPLDQQEYCPICLSFKDKVYNRLELETLDNSNQKMLSHLANNTKYYNLVCFSCQRIFQQSPIIEQMYNFEGFPNQIHQIANIIKNEVQQQIQIL